MTSGSIHCVHCGTKNKIAPADGPGPGIKECGKCKKWPVDVAALLIALDLYSDDYNPCPSCKRKNSIHNAYCFGCGKKLG